MTPWAALVLLDAVTVATFARCFDGPGELAIVVPLCVGAHLLAHLARRLSRHDHRLGGFGLWALTVVLVAFVPVALLDSSTLSWGLPLGLTQHVVSQQMDVAWNIFSTRIAPVSESRGLVLATAWAAGALALAAEALDADSGLPRVVALVPAFDIVVFTGTLGTATGRAPELAVLAALAVWYLVGATRSAHGERVVTARVEGSTAGGGALSAPAGGRRRTGFRAPPAATGLVIVAGLAAGVIGPLLPGATSAPLVEWHGSGRSSPLNRGGDNGVASAGPIVVSNLVQVDEEEIDNPDVPLFTVYGLTPTREVLAVLDDFDGNEWTEAKTSQQPLPTLVGSLTALEQKPLIPVPRKDSEQVTQVISDIDLGGDELPSPGLTTGVESIDSDVTAWLQGASGGVEIQGGLLAKGFKYAVQASLTPEPAVAQEYYDPKLAPGPAADLHVPGHVPPKIVNLAHSLVTSSENEDEKATAIENFFLSGKFKYLLPKSVPANDASGYAALSTFLFSTRTGYCQQFATAFGVLARLDGLATRLAVGFLETPLALGHDSWTVTGSDIHAWPQVYFPGTGWVDFEPTPSAGTPPYPNITTTTSASRTTTAPTTPKGVTGSSVTCLPRCRRYFPTLGVAPGFKYPTPPPQTSIPLARSNTTRASGDVAGVLLAVLAGGLLWALVIPTWRLVRRRRRRDPIRAVLFAWRQAVVALAVAGVHRRRAETFQEFATRVRRAGVLNNNAETALDRLAVSSNRALFARQGLTDDDSRRAASDAVAVRRSARRSMAWWAKLLLQLDPRDLLAGP
jgi:transglutaminase-like putative cysteine protease